MVYPNNLMDRNIPLSPQWLDKHHSHLFKRKWLLCCGLLVINLKFRNEKKKYHFSFFCYELISFSSLKFTIFHIPFTHVTRAAYEPSDGLAHGSFSMDLRWRIQSAKSLGLRCDFAWGLRIIFCHTLGATFFLISFPRLKFTIFFLIN